MLKIKQFLEKHQQPAYRLEQFYRHYYQRFVSSFDEITTFSKNLRSKMEQELEFSRLKLDQLIESPQGSTVKALFTVKRSGEKELKTETVLIKHRDGRNTLCVSCMVGCSVGCTFCATGQMGFKLKLTAAEIVDQVLFFARRLQEKNEKLTNIVYMGMGEPLLNLTEVEKSIETIIDPQKMGLSQRRLTVSTAGYPEQIKKLVDDGYDQLQLAISLHAPEQKLREKIMPIAKTHQLETLFAAIDYYVQTCNKLVSYEYILLKEVNDQPQHAKQLAELLKDRLAHVNLIPYNSVEGLPYQAPHPKQVKKFAQTLENEGVPNSIRVTMGAEINAACGQLGH